MRSSPSFRPIFVNPSARAPSMGLSGASWRTTTQAAAKVRQLSPSLFAPFTETKAVKLTASESRFKAPARTFKPNAMDLYPLNRGDHLKWSVVPIIGFGTDDLPLTRRLLYQLS